MNKTTTALLTKTESIKIIKVEDIVSACGIDYEDFCEYITSVTWGDASFTLITPNDMIEWGCINNLDEGIPEDDEDFTEEQITLLKSILQDLIEVGDVYLAFEG